MSEPLANPPAADPRTRRYVLVIAAVALIVAAWGIVARLSARMSLEGAAAQAAIATVTTTKPHAGPGKDLLVLPGSVQAFYEAPIYARTNGYLKVWHTDIGTPVKKGQLLAEIETPEVDQELRQAQADLATAQANYELARTTNVRWQGLLSTESVSQQDADQRAGDAAAKKAAQQSAQANVARLQELESFKRVLAPFDGVVTQRNTDVGALINAGQSAGNALFRVADLHRLRIYVSVPQPYASAIHTGQTAGMVFADHPGKHYEAVVANSSRALDANSRTLQVELQIDNASGELLPGSYAQVSFNLEGVDQSLRIPVNTVLFRTDGLHVAVLDQDHRVHLRTITQGRDFGTEVEVLSGITADDVLVANPPDSIIDGAQVRIAPTPPAQGKAAAGGGTGHSG
ncbi:MAG: efflux RND transporter periplasmic adaptor subunit [Proteobacteria bacterium]|nr:efflux RND transporter periplasmic adaptor subunit [Pseudomonadota bacterium]